MAPDGWTKGQTWTKLYPSAFGGDNYLRIVIETHYYLELYLFWHNSWLDKESLAEWFVLQIMDHRVTGLSLTESKIPSEPKGASLYKALHSHSLIMVEILLKMM